MRFASPLLPMLAAASLLAPGLFLAAPLHAEGEAPAPAAVPLAPAITVSTVGTRLLSDRVFASGLVAAVEEVQVAPLIEGQPIEALLADVGDRVAEGQVLARLSNSTLDLQKSQLAASLAAARATIAQAEAQMIEVQSSADEAIRANDRAKALKAQGNIAQAAADTAQAAAVSAGARVAVATQSLEAARAQLALVEAQIANVELQLSRTEVKAPFAGEITARNARLGAIATAAGQPMFTLIRDGALELRADVAEGDLLRLAPGQTATLRAVAALPGLTGTLRLVEPGVDATTRLGRARITPDSKDALRPGMFIEAEILVAEHEAVAIPVTAVGASNGTSVVMRVKDGVVEQVTVQTGIRDGGWVEILSGLAAGDTVVTKAAAFVRSGDRITPVPATPVN